MKIEMDKHLLRNVMKAIGSFSEHSVEAARADFMRGGIVLCAVDEKAVSMMLIGISKKMMKTYSIKDTESILITKGTIKEIRDFCKIGIDNDEDRKKITMRKNRRIKQKAKENDTQAVLIEPPEIDDNIVLNFDEGKINMMLGPLKRTASLEIHDLITIQNMAGIADTLAKMHNSLEKIGNMNEKQFKELLSYMNASYSFESKEHHETRTIRITKDKERFEIESEIEKGDEVIMDLNGAITKKTEEDLSIMLLSKTWYRGLNNVSKLNPNIILMGKTDHPIIVSTTGNSPADIGKFKNKVDFWFALAPRIEYD